MSDFNGGAITDKRFYGVECKKCGGTLRYKSNKSCVTCKKRNWKKERYSDNCEKQSIRLNIDEVIELRKLKSDFDYMD